ncbi:MAG: serine/threonine protein kinase [Sandaracinus sp.]|nr:serine/threonine protein kinase [Sandaracinus sp.]
MEPSRERESVPHAVPPRRVGDYEIVASLGRGGAGEAFLALVAGSSGFRKLVVLKLLHPELEESLEVVDQFLDEARLAARLNHPNIVPTLEVGRHELQHYIAMAYLEGLPLGRVLAMLNQRGEKVPPEIAARVAVELLDALEYAHDLKDFDGTPLDIVHRDVSPPNVFVCWDGSVKLLDFGIARAASRRASTDSGLIKGKFGYIAPEQASGEGTDRRADLWSVGVVLWEMLTGHRLFPARNDVGTLHALVAGQITAVTVHAPATPEGLVDVLDHVLQRDADDRYRTAAAMRDALEAWMDALPREVTRDDVAAWLGDAFVGERERQQGLLRQCIGGARLGATATGSFHVAPKGPSSESRRISTQPPPEPEKPRLAWGPIAFAAAAVLALVGIVWGSARSDDVPEERARPWRRGRSSMRLRVARSRRGPRSTRAKARTRNRPTRRPSKSPSRSRRRTEKPGRRRDAFVGVPFVASFGGETEPRREARDTEPATRRRPEAGGPATERAEEETPVEPPPEPAVETGWLSLDTTPWAMVSLDGRLLGHTPLIRLALPAGEHELVLENPERSIRRVYVVRIPAGQTVRRRIAL